MDKKELAVLPNEDIIKKLSDTFLESERWMIMRNVFLVNQTKTTWLWENKRKLTVYEAFTYTMACQELWLTPALNHIIMLEDQLYITLQGHLQNAHKSGQLIGIKTECLGTKDWPTNKNWVKTGAFRYSCTITKINNGNKWEWEYRAEWYADLDSIKNKYANSIFIEQMAEARAMRRCLARAFPVWMANIEDVQDDFVWEKFVPEDDKKFVLIKNIQECTTTEELENMKPDISKYGGKNAIAEYSKKILELKSNNEEIKEDLKVSKLDKKELKNNQFAQQVWIV